MRPSVGGERGGSAQGYLQALKEELYRVSWTTKGELKLCTQIVIGATFVFGIGIYIADVLIKGFLDGVGGLFRLLFG